MSRYGRFIILFWIWIAVFSISVLVSWSADEGRSFDDALTILGNAVETGDHSLIATLIHEEIGIDIAGNEFSGNFFKGRDGADEYFEFQVFNGDEQVVVKTTTDNFLWGEDGLFAAIEDVTLTHYEMVDRDEIQDEALIDRWEHGELETAVVVMDDYTFYLYVLPEMKWRLTFERIDGDWYLTAIAARAV